MDTREVIQAVTDRTLPVVEDNPHYRIHECVVKEYPAWRLLVQSSMEPIELGEAMLPFMDTERIHAYARSSGFERRDNTPIEVYVFNWVEHAQGPMIFDVGYVVDDDFRMQSGPEFVIKELPTLKVASIIYHGPFPHERMSGWGNIEWEQRARDKGLVYTEKLYRELYHCYDFESHWHITEVQMAIK